MGKKEKKLVVPNWSGKTLASWLREFRSESHLTQEALADLLSVAPSTIQSIEQEQRGMGPAIVNKILKHLRLSPENEKEFHEWVKSCKKVLHFKRREVKKQDMALMTPCIPKVISREDRTFGEALHACRKAKGLSQKKLAHAVALSTTELSLMERGKVLPPSRQIQLLGKILELEPKEISFLITLGAQQGHSIGWEEALQWPTIMEERFDEWSPQWNMQNSQDGGREVSKNIECGKYYLELLTKQDYGSVMGANSLIHQPDHFCVSVEMEKISGPATSGGGLLFGVVNDSENYVFCIRPTLQQFFIAGVVNDGVTTDDWTEFYDWQHPSNPSVIHQIGMNTIGIIGDVTNFKFVINDVVVAQIKQDVPRGRRLDIAVEGRGKNERTRVTFDNLILRQPDPAKIYP